MGDVMSSDSYQPKQGETANSQMLIKVTEADLPLHCPSEGMRLWDSHPRVYLPIEKESSVLCPYCGTHYVLVK